MSEIEKKYITLEEVKKHNEEGNGWIIIKDMVFDISEYADRHPGGEIILDYVGQDGTEAFSNLIRWRTSMG